MDRDARIQKLHQLLRERIVVIDGAMGTMIQALELSPEDFGGPNYDGCNEYLNLTKPDLIRTIHQGYLTAGADIIETNTFGSTPLVLAEYQLADQSYEISRAGASLAREVADAFSTPEWLRFVAGSMGPTTKAISVTGGVSWDGLAEHYKVQAVGLIQGGVDLLLIETSQDTLNVKAALEGIDQAFEETGQRVPISIQCTIETMGTMLGGQDIEAFYTSVCGRELLWIGMNCATGPTFMRDHLRTLAAISRFPIAVVPNAGLPDENGQYNETPEVLSSVISFYAREGWVNIIGGCCGTEYEHINSLLEIAHNQPPRQLVENHTTVVSGLDPFTIDEDTRPVIVGERTNVLGSRLFKRLISDSNIEEAAELGRRQVRNGAHILDVCLQDPDRNEVSDMTAFLDVLIRKVKAPLMIDSTDPQVIEEALKRTPGKCIINSINLEDGEDRFNAVVPLAKRFGAALIVGCIDDNKEQAQAITRQRKLDIALRSYKLLTEKYGIRGEDIIFDALVFPIGTGDENYIGAGVETIEGVRSIKQSMPLAKTILGISNVSFGLPPAGREVLNAVFLYHCVQAGLDSAIVNSERLIRYPLIPEEERQLAENLIWWSGNNAITAFANHFRTRKVQQTQSDRKSRPLNDRIASCIVEGTKTGLIEDLNEAMNERTPLEIINGPLMAGMSEVGRLFAQNELIVAEVLESAEAMKAAVTHLEPHMESSAAASRGSIMLATVKGDVHDIGKNLVDIILSNNGYEVINLGIKIPPQELIAAYQQYKPDIIGLSGLLVKSAQMMVDTVRDFRAVGIRCPVLVGGAALTNRFTRLRIGTEYDGLVAYARDAMSGLELANLIHDEQERKEMAARFAEETLALQKDDEAKQSSRSDLSSTKLTVANIHTVEQPPTPPDLRLHVIRNHDLSEIFEYINPVMLYTRHLGYRGRFLEAIANGDTRAIELRDKVTAVEEIMLARSDITANAVYAFFRAASEGDDVVLLAPNGNQILERFRFGRQSSGDGLCLSDYLQPMSSGKVDYIGAFVTTVGGPIRELAEQWKQDGDYLALHILQTLALEGAEAFAEVLHQRMRAKWGFPDPTTLSKEDIFRTNYQGRRYSFGYPACPNLEDQEILWRLLEPKASINVDLTDGYMMDPEGSVSALVFHHPQAKYFNLSQEDIASLEVRVGKEQTTA
ncbi:MAG: methionine synthase [Chloroflexota bacterium]|nr:methionine synthase [Chloroflexota bacterium]